MQTVELFAGTKSFSKVMAARGHKTFTVERNPAQNPHLCADVSAISAADLPAGIDLLWASPPCQAFSVAAIGKNWNRDYAPKSFRAVEAQKLVAATARLIGEASPRWWLIENPRGMLRKLPMLEDFIKERGGVRVTVCYCQYGDTRQKPTDIWTNATWWVPRPCCKPGAACHVAAPRGSRTGTQGLANATERGRIPPALFEELLAQMPADATIRT